MIILYHMAALAALVGIDVGVLVAISYVRFSSHWYKKNWRYRQLQKFLSSVKDKGYKIQPISSQKLHTLDQFFDVNQAIIRRIFVTHFIDQKLSEFVHEIRRHSLLCGGMVFAYAALKLTAPVPSVTSAHDLWSLFASWRLPVSVVIDIVVLVWLFAEMHAVLQIIPAHERFFVQDTEVQIQRDEARSSM